jgi:hypothetical protein
MDFLRSIPQEAFLIALGVLNILDVLTTRKALTKVAGAYEANGVMAKLMDKIGLEGTLLLKLVVAGGILYYLYDIGPSGSELELYGYLAVTGGYLFVVWNNYRVIKRGG